MLGIHGLFPLLKGWDYKSYPTSTRTIKRGSTVEVLRVSEDLGWLVQINLVATDCFAGAEITYQGGDLKPRIARATIQSAYITGALTPSPIGWTPLYYRPVPTSTYGVYSAIAYVSYGLSLPYLPTVITKFFLEDTSTQTSTEMSANAIAIQITQRKLFIRTLRKVLGTKNMTIDPALLKVGETILNQLEGEDWTHPKGDKP